MKEPAARYIDSSVYVTYCTIINSLILLKPPNHNRYNRNNQYGKQSLFELNEYSYLMYKCLYHIFSFIPQYVKK